MTIVKVDSVRLECSDENCNEFLQREGGPCIWPATEATERGSMGQTAKLLGWNWEEGLCRNHAELATLAKLDGMLADARERGVQPKDMIWRLTKDTMRVLRNVAPYTKYMGIRVEESCTDRDAISYPLSAVPQPTVEPPWVVAGSVWKTISEQSGEPKAPPGFRKDALRNLYMNGWLRKYNGQWWVKVTPNGLGDILEALGCIGKINENYIVLIDTDAGCPSKVAVRRGNWLAITGNSKFTFTVSGDHASLQKETYWSLAHAVEYGLYDIIEEW